MLTQTETNDITSNVLDQYHLKKASFALSPQQLFGETWTSNTTFQLP